MGYIVNCLKRKVRLGLVVHAYNLRLRQEDCEVVASLHFRVRHYQEREKRKTERKKEEGGRDRQKKKNKSFKRRFPLRRGLEGWSELPELTFG